MSFRMLPSPSLQPPDEAPVAPRSTNGTRVFTEAIVFTRDSAGMKGRRLRSPPTLLGGFYLLVLFVLWMLNLADLLLTMHWTGDVGWAAEGNDIMRHVAHLFGPAGFALYKVLLMTFVVAALWWLYLRFEAESAAARRPWQMRALEGMRIVAFSLTFVLLGFYTWVIWNNLHISGFL